MDELPPSDPKITSRQMSKDRARKVGKQAVRLTGREYLPMGITILFWLVVGLGVGAADAARLLAVTVLIRAPAMLTQMAVMPPVRRRWHQSKEVRRQAIKVASLIELGVLAMLAIEVALICVGLVAIHQQLVAEMLLIVSLGYPAKLYRGVDLRTNSRLFRLYTTGAMLAGAGIAYLLNAGPLAYALVFALREYVALILVPLIQRRVPKSKGPTDEPLTFGEVAKTTVVNSRRMLTYRLTKNLLAVLGPFGNFAARTGRGLNMHSRLEPYMPHKRGGFAIFALLTAGIAVALAVHSGKPLAMIAGAGAMQLSAIACNVLLWWRYLPDRKDPNLIIEDDDDD